jgi:hypothetical protein
LTVLKLQRFRCHLDIIILKTVEYETNLKTFVILKVEIFRKIEELTSRSCKKFQKGYEYDHFQNARNYVIFQSANEYDAHTNSVCTYFKYPSIEVRITGFTSHLNTCFKKSYLIFQILI